MAKINGLDKYSYAELLDLQGRVGAAIVERKASDAKDVKQKLEELARKSGFSVSELFGSERGRKRGSGVIKYRNPKDASQTWSGRGRRPNWLVEAVKKGAKLESLSS